MRQIYSLWKIFTIVKKLFKHFINTIFEVYYKLSTLFYHIRYVFNFFYFNYIRTLTKNSIKTQKFNLKSVLIIYELCYNSKKIIYF